MRNSGVVWDPQTGPGERYVKRHPVPFGEYIPFRAQLSGWIERLDQIPRDFYAGDRPGNLDVGPAAVGDVICFEVAYDGLVRDVVTGGADVLVVQTNNATYNGTGQPQQQMAMSRLRAVEHGRTVLVAATSGISAVVAPDGEVVAAGARSGRPGPWSRRSRCTTAGRWRPGSAPARSGCSPPWAWPRPGLRWCSAAGAGAARARGAAAVTAGAGPGAHGRVLVVIPTYDERLNIEPVVGAGPGRGARRRRAGRRRREPGRHRRASRTVSRPRTGRSTSCTGSGSRASAAPTWPASAGGCSAATTCWWRWTPTGRTSPSSCPTCWPRCADADLVLGSRWVPGGSVVNWPRSRELLSRGGNTYVRVALGLQLRDATGGFRAFRRETLDKLDLDAVASQGYCFQVDLARRAVSQGLRVVEVPIEFVEREHGVSKMSGAIVREALWRVTVWGLARPLRGPADARLRRGGR